ncbi:MAG: hypothetical protein Unbinned1312contig1001_37 [Prokaryotic dsDNA virus sp.]|nr:MAG: hypothetical protein Unbinned1312contig1001_37 [Prokaryotic dsDNA virus sp.]
MEEDKDRKPSLGQEMISTLTDENARSLAKDYAELAIDAISGNELIQAIPVFGTVFGLARGALSIHTALWEQKVLKFLSHTDGATEEEWTEFAEKLSNEKGGTSRAGEALLSHLERLDDSDKARLTGMLYVAAARGELTISELKRCCMIIDRVYLDDLDEFAMVVYSAGGGLVEARDAMMFLGLVDRLTNSKVRGGIGPEQDEPTSIALKLLHVVSEEGRLR